MTLIQRSIYLLLATLVVSGCKVPYHPADPAVATGFLVVEGVINNGVTDSTFIKLSRTVHLYDNTIDNSPEYGAEVYVEDGNGFSVKLKELTKGSYATGPLGLNNSRKYRLRIKTNANKTYLSEMLNIIPTPSIDSIGYYMKDNGIQIYVNTHDPANKARYYRWDYNEAWKFHAAQISEFVTDGVKVVPRTPEQMYPKNCWGSARPTNIVVGSSVKLAQDVIYQQPISFIPGTSDKIMDRYRITVRQYALSKEAFIFWQELKRNTESLGSIFDAQPSANSSNIHYIDNPDEPVVGYISIANVQTKVTYIDRADIPLTTVSDYINGCSRPDSMFFCHPLKVGPNEPPKCFGDDVASYLIPQGSAQIPVTGFWLGARPQLGRPNGYTAANTPCVDCSLSGSKIAPADWKDY